MNSSELLLRMLHPDRHTARVFGGRCGIGTGHCFRNAALGLLGGRALALLCVGILAHTGLAATNQDSASVGSGRYVFSVLAGTPGVRGSADGVGGAARFDQPTGVAVDAVGNVYVCERELGTIRKIAPGGKVMTLAGAPGERGSRDGLGSNARFTRPFGLAVDGGGNVYVADIDDHTIRKIDSSGYVTTFAGRSGETGDNDGPREVARLHSPLYVAADGDGNVFFTETGPPNSPPGRAIRKIAPDGAVSRLTVSLPEAFGDFGGYHDYAIAWPGELGVDGMGNLYVNYSDAWDFADVVKLTPTFDGTYWGRTLRPPAPLRCATGMGVDGVGHVHVKYGTGPLCRFSPGGEVEVRYVSGNSGGIAWDGMSVDQLGRVFVVPGWRYQERAGAIEVGAFDPAASGHVFLQQPSDNSAEPGSGVYFTVQVAGTSLFTYQWYFNSAPILGATQSILYFRNVQYDHTGYYSVLLTDSTGSVASRLARFDVVRPTVPALPAGR